MDHQDRYAALSARLREQAGRYPEPLQRLGKALWEEADTALSHESCLDALPEFVEAELAGERVAERFPDIKHHLDRCDTCVLVYAELLDAEWASAQGTLEASVLPAPDLSFLPEPNVALQELVLEWTRRIVQRLAPPDLANFDRVAPLFFAQLHTRTAHEDRSPYLSPLSMDLEDTGIARTLLESSYKTTQTLGARTSRAEFDIWINQGELKQHLTAQAASAARELRIERGLAERFASAFADEIAADPGRLRALLK